MAKAESEYGVNGRSKNEVESRLFFRRAFAPLDFTGRTALTEVDGKGTGKTALMDHLQERIDIVDSMDRYTVDVGINGGDLNVYVGVYRIVA